MKTNFLSLAAIFTIALFSNNLTAQTVDTENTTAGAVLIQALVITEVAPMHFGSNVLISAAAGTVVLPSDSTIRTYTGGVATSPATPVATNAAYTITGTGLETYALVLPATTTVTHTTIGSNTMTITDMTARFNGAGADAVTSTLTAGGTDSFTLGGTLTVKAAQVGGIYAGTFDISVDYN